LIRQPECARLSGLNAAWLLAFVLVSFRVLWCLNWPVTPEVAGSSPVAPVTKAPRMRGFRVFCSEIDLRHLRGGIGRCV
jgi:hypothetical protein